MAEVVLAAANQTNEASNLAVALPAAGESVITMPEAKAVEDVKKEEKIEELHQPEILTANHETHNQDPVPKKEDSNIQGAVEFLQSTDDDVQLPNIPENGPPPPCEFDKPSSSLTAQPPIYDTQKLDSILKCIKDGNEVLRSLVEQLKGVNKKVCGKEQEA